MTDAQPRPVLQGRVDVEPFQPGLSCVLQDVRFRTRCRNAQLWQLPTPPRRATGVVRVPVRQQQLADPRGIVSVANDIGQDLSDTVARDPSPHR